MTQNRCLSTEEIRKSSFRSKAKQNKYVKLCTEVQSCFFYFNQQPQPQSLLLLQPQSLPHPQPLFEKRITKRMITRMRHQLFPQPKFALHIKNNSLKKMYLKRFCLRFIVHSMPWRKKCYKNFPDYPFRLLSHIRRGIIL